METGAFLDQIPRLVACRWIQSHRQEGVSKPGSEELDRYGVNGHCARESEAYRDKYGRTPGASPPYQVMAMDQESF